MLQLVGWLAPAQLRVQRVVEVRSDQLGLGVAATCKGRVGRVGRVGRLQHDYPYSRLGRAGNDEDESIPNLGPGRFALLPLRDTVRFATSIKRRRILLSRKKKCRRFSRGSTLPGKLQQPCHLDATSIPTPRYTPCLAPGSKALASVREALGIRVRPSLPWPSALAHSRPCSFSANKTLSINHRPPSALWTLFSWPRKPALTFVRVRNLAPTFMTRARKPNSSQSNSVPHSIILLALKLPVSSTTAQKARALFDMCR